MGDGKQSRRGYCSIMWVQLLQHSLLAVWKILIETNGTSRYAETRRTIPLPPEEFKSSIYFLLALFLEKSVFNALNEVYRGLLGFKKKNTNTHAKWMLQLGIKTLSEGESSVGSAHRVPLFTFRIWHSCLYLVIGAFLRLVIMCHSFIANPVAKSLQIGNRCNVEMNNAPFECLCFHLLHYFLLSFAPTISGCIQSELPHIFSSGTHTKHDFYNWIVPFQ